jgi:hypothetical protein
MAIIIDPTAGLDELLSRESILETLKQLDEATMKAMIHTIMRQALSQENVHLARHLAALGRTLYPDDAEMATAVRVLAPPKVLEVKRPAKPGLNANTKWLRDNSSRYANQWVALRNGELLGTGQSRQDLVAQLGETANAAETYIVRIA